MNEQITKVINDNITDNGNEEITGKTLRQVLATMVTYLNFGAIFSGSATPETNPGSPDLRVFYIAPNAGMYPNFGGITTTSPTILSNVTGAWKAYPIGGISMRDVDEKYGQSLEHLRDNAAAYNVDAYHTPAGSYFTAEEARAAVPAAIRKKGLIITYQSGASTAQIEWFNGDSVVNWADASKWQNLRNMVGDLSDRLNDLEEDAAIQDANIAAASNSAAEAKQTADSAKQQANANQNSIAGLKLTRSAANPATDGDEGVKVTLNNNTGPSSVVIPVIKEDGSVSAGLITPQMYEDFMAGGNGSEGGSGVSSSFINVNAEYPKVGGYHSIEEAIAAVPESRRKAGAVIAYGDDTATGFIRFFVDNNISLNWPRPECWQIAGTTYVSIQGTEELIYVDVPGFSVLIDDEGRREIILARGCVPGCLDLYLDVVTLPEGGYLSYANTIFKYVPNEVFNSTPPTSIDDYWGFLGEFQIFYTAGISTLDEVTIGWACNLIPDFFGAFIGPKTKASIPGIPLIDNVGLLYFGPCRESAPANALISSTICDTVMLVGFETVSESPFRLTPLWWMHRYLCDVPANYLPLPGTATANVKWSGTDAASTYTLAGELNEKTELVIIFAGKEDFRINIPAGEVVAVPDVTGADYSSAYDMTTLCGGMQATLHRIRATRPNARIFVGMTPGWKNHVRMAPDTPGYEEKMKKIASLYGAKFIDTNELQFDKISHPDYFDADGNLSETNTEWARMAGEALAGLIERNI